MGYGKGLKKEIAFELTAVGWRSPGRENQERVVPQLIEPSQRPPLQIVPSYLSGTSDGVVGNGWNSLSRDKGGKEEEPYGGMGTGRIGWRD